MYHYAREGKNRKSWPTVETICEALDINPDTLHKWRKYLITNGWLEKVGDHRRLDGEFNVPEFKAKRGTVPEAFGDGRSSNRIRTRNNQGRTRPKTSGGSEPKTSGADRTEIIRDEVDSGVLDSARVESGLLESEPALALSASKPETLGQDELDFHAVVEMSVEDEARIIESLPADLIRWTERPPLGTPLVIGENYHEADASFARDVADELLVFGNIERDRALFVSVVDYDDIWDLDIGFGVGTAIALAEEVVRHCPKHRSWIYHYLARQMTTKVPASTEYGQDYRTESVPGSP